MSIERSVEKIRRLRDSVQERRETEEEQLNRAARRRLQDLRSAVGLDRGIEADDYERSARRIGKRPRSTYETEEDFTPRTRPISTGPVVSLRQAVGLPLDPPPLRDSALIIIDAQNTYTEGPLKLFKVEAALRNCSILLQRARKAKIPVFHVQHDAGPGTLYDVSGYSGAIVDMLAPKHNEPRIVKKFPNAFEGTDLEQQLTRVRARNLVIVGFMTHCCINSTARAAFNLQYDSVTVVADCTATRALPDPTGKGESVPASSQQRAALAAINDLHCNVVATGSHIP